MTKVKNEGTHSRSSATVWISPPSPFSFHFYVVSNLLPHPILIPPLTLTSGTQSHPDILSVPPLLREHPISQICLVRRLNRISVSRVQGRRILNSCWGFPHGQTLVISLVSVS